MKPATAVDSHEIAEAIKDLDAAEKRIRRVKLATSAITVDHIDRARLHCRALLADVSRSEREV